MLNRGLYLSGFADALRVVDSFREQGLDPVLLITNEIDMSKAKPWNDWDRGYADGKLASVGM